MSTLRPEVIIVTNSIANLNTVEHFQRVNKFMHEKYDTVTYAYNDNLFNINAYSENITDKAIVVNIKSNSFNVNSTENCVFSKTSDYSSWLIKGWKYTRGRWYYLGNDYMPLSGWQKINYQGKDRWFFFDNNNYYMYLGWQKLDWNGKNNWYYFSEVTDENATKGEMLLGWQRLTYNNQLDWYYFNNSGAMVTGWQKLDWNGKSSWYYFAKSGAMATGWRYLDWDGKYNFYYFDTTPGVRGAMYTGTHVIDGVTYEFDKSGACTNCNNLFDANSIADNTVEKKMVSNSLDFTMPEEATETKQYVYNSNSTYVPELDKTVELASNLDKSDKKLTSKNKMFSTTYTNKNNVSSHDSKHTKLYIIIGSFISLAVIIALVVFITIEVKKKKN